MDGHLLQGREQPPGRLCTLAAKPLFGVNGHSTAGSAEEVCPFSFRRHSEIPRRMALCCFLRYLSEEKFPKRISQKKILHVSPRLPFWHKHIVTSGLVILAALTVVTPENTGAQCAPWGSEGKLIIQHHMTNSYKAPLPPFSAQLNSAQCFESFFGDVWHLSPSHFPREHEVEFKLSGCGTRFQAWNAWIWMPGKMNFTQITFLTATFSPYFPYHPKKPLNTSTFSSAINYTAFDKLVLQNHPQFFQTMQATPY